MGTTRRLAEGPSDKDRVDLVSQGSGRSSKTRARVTWQGRQFDLSDSAFLGFSDMMEGGARAFRALQVRSVAESFVILEREGVVYAFLDMGDGQEAATGRPAWTLLVHGDHLDRLLHVWDARPSVVQTRGVTIELDVATDDGIEPQRVVLLTPESSALPVDVAARVLTRRVKGNGVWWPHPAEAQLLWAYHIVCVRGAAVGGDRTRLSWLASRDGNRGLRDRAESATTELAVSMLRDAQIAVERAQPILSAPFARPASDLVESSALETPTGIRVDRLFAERGANDLVRQISKPDARLTFDFLSSLEGQWFPRVRHYEEDQDTGWFSVERVVGPRIRNAESVIRTWTFDEARQCVVDLMGMAAAVVSAGESPAHVHADSVQICHARPFLAAGARPLDGPGSSTRGVRHILEAVIAPYFPEFLSIAKLVTKDHVTWASVAEKARGIQPRKADNPRAQALRLAALGRYGEATEILVTLDDRDRERSDVTFWRNHIATWEGDHRRNAADAETDDAVDDLPPAIRRSDVICARVIDEVVRRTADAPRWARSVVETHLERGPSAALVDLILEHGVVLPNVAAGELAEAAFRAEDRRGEWYGLIADLLVRDANDETLALDAALRDRCGALLSEVDHPAAWTAVSQLAFRAGRHELAVALARRVLADDPYDIGCARVLARSGVDGSTWWRHVARLDPHDREAAEAIRSRAWESMVPPREADDDVDLDDLSPREVWDRVSLAVQGRRPGDALVLAESLLERMPELETELSPLVERLRFWDGASRRSEVTTRIPLRREEPSAIRTVKNSASTAETAANDDGSAAAETRDAAA